MIISICFVGQLCAAAGAAIAASRIAVAIHRGVVIGVLPRLLQC
ncbi:MAG: hypothetical protein ACREVB_15300 [Burkholderiales bacterium]